MTKTESLRSEARMEKIFFELENFSEMCDSWCDCSEKGSINFSKYFKILKELDEPNIKRILKEIDSEAGKPYLSKKANYFNSDIIGGFMKVMKNEKNIRLIKCTESDIADRKFIDSIIECVDANHCLVDDMSNNESQFKYRSVQNFMNKANAIKSGLAVQLPTYVEYKTMDQQQKDLYTSAKEAEAIMPSYYILDRDAKEKIRKEFEWPENYQCVSNIAEVNQKILVQFCELVKSAAKKRAIMHILI